MKTKIITSLEILVSILLVTASGFIGAILASAMEDYENRGAIITIATGMVAIILYLAVQIFFSAPGAKRTWSRPPVIQVDETIKRR
jgi:hypothetical protein